MYLCFHYFDDDYDKCLAFGKVGSGDVFKCVVLFYNFFFLRWEILEKYYFFM